MNVKKVFLAYNLNSACSYHRVILPFQFMNSKEIEIVNNIESAEVVFYNRICNGYKAEELIKLKNKYHFKIIVDIDDYWYLNHTHYLYDAYRSSDMSTEIEKSIKIADYVIVTTYELFLLCKKINKNVVIVPNALPYDTIQFNYHKSESDSLRFIYLGGSSHLPDVQIFRDRIFENLNAEFIYAGFNPCCYESIGMKNSFSFKNKKLIPYLPLSNYMRAYKSSDVSLAPLKNNFFNRCKSNLKVLEAGCKYNPIICSKVKPYYNSKLKKYIDYATNKNEWFEIMSYYVKNRNYVIEKGLALGTFVREEFNLNKVNDIRRELILL